MASSKNKRAKKKFLGKRQAAGYVAVGRVGALQWAERDRWFSWQDVLRMQRDPQIRMGKRILCAPLYSATWTIDAATPVVKHFVHQTFTRIWARALNKILRFLDYGHCAGETDYSVSDRDQTVQFEQLNEFHPLDCVPMRWPATNELAGVHVRNVRYRSDHQGEVTLAPPNSFWAAHEAEYGQFYGHSIYEGAWEPWWEKRARHGATDIRRLWFLKNAYNGGIIRHPAGQTEVADGVFMSNQDIARELIEKLETGGILVMPSARHGPDGDFLWVYEPPKENGKLEGLLEYIHTLDKEILIGMGVPPEVLEAAEVGSGWSGRSVPFKILFSTLDQVLAEVMDAADDQICRPLVEANFGTSPRAEYEIKPDSLVEQAEKTNLAAGANVRLPVEDDSPISRMTGAANGRVDAARPANAAQAALRTMNGAANGQPPQRRMSMADLVSSESVPGLNKRIREMAAKRFPKLVGIERNGDGHWTRPAKATKAQRTRAIVREELAPIQMALTERANVPAPIAMPQPVINVAAPVVNVAAPVVNVAAPPPTVVNVAAPVPANVTVEAPNVTIEAPPPAVVNVAAPNVTVEAPPAPDVTVHVEPESPKPRSFIMRKDRDGNVTGEIKPE